MNRNYLDRQLKKRKDLKYYEIKPVGSALRLKRKELKMTLEESAEGICSVSYLSKLENNQIQPNLNFLDKLYQKFGMTDELSYDDVCYENDIVELVEKMLMQEPLSRTYTDHYEGREDHQARVIHIIESTLRRDYKSMLDSFKIVTQFIPQLKQNELSLMILCYAEGMIIKQQYSEAYEIVCEIPLNYQEHYSIYLLTLRMRLLLSFFMHKTSDIHVLYHHYLKLVNHEGYYHLAKEMRFSHLLHLAHYHVPQEIETIAKSVDRSNVLQKKPYAIACFIHHQYDVVIQLAKERQSLKEWFIIYLLSLEELHRYEEIHDLITHQKKEELTPNEQLLLAYVKLKYAHDRKPFLSYLRNTLLNNKIECDDPFLLEYLMLDASRQFQKSQYYKEANLVVSQYQPRIKKLKLAYSKHQG
jgi:transcriptional regulator with XRE-family HTH domain